jgi:hypothetical protein
LICDVLQKIQGTNLNQAKLGNQPRRNAVASLPAIPFKVVAE